MFKTMLLCLFSFLFLCGQTVACEHLDCLDSAKHQHAEAHSSLDSEGHTDHHDKGSERETHHHNCLHLPLTLVSLDLLLAPPQTLQQKKNFLIKQKKSKLSKNSPIIPPISA